MTTFQDMIDLTFKLKSLPTETLFVWNMNEFVESLKNLVEVRDGAAPRFCAIPVEVDRTLPAGTVEFRDPRNGAVLLRVEGL